MEEKNKYELDMPSLVLQNPENDYELVDFSTNARRDNARPTETTLRKKASEQKTWKRLLLVIAALQCLIVLLLLALLALMLLQLYARDAISPDHTSTSTAGGIASTGNIVFPNFTKWSDNIVIKVHQSLPDFNEWANRVISKVNSNVTQCLPDFSEWANSVVSKVNSNVTRSIPDFNEWANGVVSKVNSNVTGSLPDFNEWANGVVSKVNSNVTGSLPDFNEWANGAAQNTFQLLQSSPNYTELNEQILQTTRDSAQKLINIVNTLSNLENTSTSTAGVVDNILLIAQELLVLHNDSTAVMHNDSTALPTSCKEIKERQPLSPSGVYLLSNTSSTYTAYCNMEELCNSTGGWTRLAYLDMTDATQNCPSGFRLYQSGGVRACGKSSGGCVSVQFPSNGTSYSQICGRVTGYQYGHVDTLNYHVGINSYYVDGVSITRGSPRQHVWTLMAGGNQVFSYECPCNTGSTVSVQSFIGNNYFCESGNPYSSTSSTLYTSDPLWDGQGCGSLESPCCNVPGIPWFHRDYGSNTTTDYIELRVCTNAGGEDSPVSYYEIYVK
uniref:Fibrinogen C-terminal domain-containing protein n=1 Tax=Amphimedon queenslandica TaxID=400682 RepID=A0A1X7URW5_AMPQE